MNKQAVAQRLAIAGSQSKRVEREVRILKQMLAELREELQTDLQPKEAQGNGSNSSQ